MENNNKNISLEKSIAEILGQKLIITKKLQKLGIETVRDLLWYFPNRYEDFSKTYKIADLEPGQEATIVGKLTDINIKRTWKKMMSITEAVISDDSDSIRVVWFNQPYVVNSLNTEKIMSFSGKVSKSRDGELYFANPLYETLKNGEEAKRVGKLIAIYPETKGITSRGIRFAIATILKNKPQIEEYIPKFIIDKYHLPEMKIAIENIHSPKKIEDALSAKERFYFDNLFLLQLFNLKQKMKIDEQKARSIEIDLDRIRKIISELPFELTHPQKQSLWDIIKDVEKTRPMNRLLQGDVGSGKTIIATIIAMVSAEKNFQSAIMAPTEILARQHFETIKKLYKNISKDIQPTIGLLTSSEAFVFYENDMQEKISKKKFIEKIQDGKILIILGTHALIQKNIKFKNLGFVVIDEQHRFGVRQRQFLTNGKNTKSDNEKTHIQKGYMPHFLSMSATPIPRTLMLSIFGDLNLSLINELPKGRKPIETTIVSPNERNNTYNFIRKEIKTGRQAFVVCPKIENKNEEEINIKKSATFYGGKNFFFQFNGDDLKSVKTEYENLSKKIFPDLKIAMIYGKMPTKEKEKIMNDFRDRKTDILVSTSVIEVGVDIPNATIMMIEGADNFGLAQLYQFRGRVGRGEHQSYCFLMTESTTDSGKRRLKAIKNAKNGFELAEEDMKIRGPGEFLGEAQSGFSDTMIQALKNPKLAQETRESAIETIKTDSLLKSFPKLKEELRQFEENIHKE